MATKTKKLADTKVERFVAPSLKISLTPEEIADRADRASQLVASRDSKESDMKASQANAKSVIAEMDSRLRMLLNEVRTKSTYGAVECERTFDYKMGRVKDVRCDSGEIIEERNMTFAEKQRELPFEMDEAANGVE